MNGAQNITKSHAAKLKLDERNHVEKPILNQLHGLGWEIMDLDSKHRATTTAGRLLEIPVTGNILTYR